MEEPLRQRPGRHRAHDQDQRRRLRRSSASCRRACAFRPTPTCGGRSCPTPDRRRSATTAQLGVVRPARARRHRAAGRRPRCPASPRGSQQQYPDTNKDVGAGADDVQRALQRRPDPDRVPRADGSGRLRAADCLRQRRQPAARALVAADARDWPSASRSAPAAAAIVRQLLVESTLLACVGGVLGLGLSLHRHPAVRRGGRRRRQAVLDPFTMDYRVFGFMALVCLGTGLLFGLAPALQVSTTNVNEIAEGGRPRQRRRRRARRLTSAMVVAELTLTLVLLTGAGLMVRSFLKLYAMDLGVDSQHMLTMRTTLSGAEVPDPGEAAAVLRGAAVAARGAPRRDRGGDGDHAAARGRRRPDRSRSRDGRPRIRRAAPRVSLVRVSPGYFDVLGIPLARGRASLNRRHARRRDRRRQRALRRALLQREDPLGTPRSGPHAEPAPTHPDPGSRSSASSRPCARHEPAVDRRDASSTSRTVSGRTRPRT